MFLQVRLVGSTRRILTPTVSTSAIYRNINTDASSGTRRDLGSILKVIPTTGKESTVAPKEPEDTSEYKIRGYTSAYGPKPPHSFEILGSIIDPIANAATAFHPAVIRAIKAFKHSPRNSRPLEQLVEEHKMAMNILIEMNNRMQKYIGFPIGGTNSGKAIIAMLESPTLASKLQTVDIQTIAAILVVTLPRNILTWKTLDTLLTDYLRKRASHWKVEEMLLVAYAFKTAKTQLNLYNHTFTAAELIRLRLIEELCTKKDTIFDDSPVVDVVINYTGDSKAHPSYSAERLSLVLTTIAMKPLEADDHGLLPSPSSRPSLGMQRDLSFALSSLIKNTLLTLAHPIRFLTLRYIWEALPGLKFSESYIIYKSLFEQIHLSVSTDPLQLVNQEAAIASLLDTMITLQHKNMALIECITTEVSERGLSMTNYSIGIYNSLTELGAEGASSQMLQKLMLEATTNANRMFFSGRFSVIPLSDAAKEKISCMLREKTETYSYADYIIALSVFSRYADKKLYRQFCVIEEALVPQVSKLGLGEVVNMMFSFAHVGRKYPDLLREVDSYLDTHFDKVDNVRIVRLIWSCARINHTPLYFDKAINKTFVNLSTWKSLYDSPIVMQLLWSLAVLGQLTMERFFLLEGYIPNKRSSQNPFMLMQLKQSIIELQLSYADNVDALRILSKWESAVQQNIMENQGSSYFHSDVSKVLREMGIKHVNEKVLSKGMIVDIFVESKASSKYKGLVIEVDGLQHYDSYLMEPLGPTVMKRRHLRALGYEVISLPVVEYNITASLEQKVTILSKLLERSLVLSSK